MSLPDLLYLGADKAGSTWLHAALDSLEDTFVPPAKDTRFFLERFGEGLEWYHQFYSSVESRDVRTRAEVCHDYLYSPLALERIAVTLSDEARFVVFIRQPVDRSVSSVLNYRFAGARAPLNRLVARHPDITSNSLYSLHLKIAFEVLGAERVAVFSFDQIRRDPHQLLQSILSPFGIQVDSEVELPGPTRTAAIPRSVTAARLSKGGARALRAAGAENLLGAIKNSASVRKALSSSQDVSVDRASTRRSVVCELGLGAMFQRDLDRLLAMPLSTEVRDDIARWQREIADTLSER